MVKAWIKQLKVLNNSSKINFDSIILDIFNWKLEKYDVKALVWYDDLYRVRIWVYRIIFENRKSEIKILFIWKRWDVYKWLRKI